MPDPIPDLREVLLVLRECVACTRVAITNLRFDISCPADRYIVGLISVIRDYACGIIALGEAGTFAAMPGTVRSAQDAYVDLVNLCDHPDYWKHLEAADAFSWSKLLEAASRGDNPNLRALSESEVLPAGRSIYAQRRKGLAAQHVTKLEIDERFEMAELPHDHESAYAMLSAQAHNNVSMIEFRYFDLRSDKPSLRQSPDGSEPPGFSLADAIVISELLLAAAEKTLKHFGHGLAIISRARAKFEKIEEILREHGDQAGIGNSR